VTVTVEVLSEVTSEAVEAFGRLLPQLSASAERLDAAALGAIVAAQSSIVLMARTADQRIAGVLTLVMFSIPTGQRARIEDVVVDEAARGQGIGEALTLEALRLARQAGVRNVDLTSRPSRQAAGRLYQRLGFEERDSRIYRYTFS
jgi:ribosomal protein S18 acetylase RimI-like enzyme